MRLDLVSVTFALTLAVVPLEARAGFVYQFGLNGSTPTTAFTIPTAGGTAEVQIFLVEDVGGTTLLDEQLFSAGVRLNWSDPAIASLRSVGDITANPAFDFVETSVHPTSATLEVAAFLNPFVDPDGQNRVLLGTFRFTAQAPGTMTLTATDFGPTDGVVTGLGSPLDGDLANGSATLEAGGTGPTAVPAPPSLVLWGVGLLALVSCGASRLRADHSRQLTDWP